jgi:capsid portal protein
LGRSIHTIKKNTQALVVARREKGLEGNADNFIAMPQEQNAGRSHNKKSDNISSERVEEFKYLETTLTNQNSLQEEIKSRWKSGNAFYHLVQNLLSSSLLSKNIKIKVCRTTVFPVVLYGRETWPLTLREERRLRVFENMVLRRLFEPKMA